MKSDPVEPAHQAGNVALGRRRIGLVVLRAAILLLVVCCLWLIYPFAKIRICVSRLAAYYTPVVDPATNSIVGFNPRAEIHTGDQRIWWEEELANQPTTQLLELLMSDDPVRVWVVAQAIETQTRNGRPIGWLDSWRGKRKPVRLDARSVEAILSVLDNNLPPAAAEPLVRILGRLESQSPDQLSLSRDSLLRATERRHWRSRCFGMHVLNAMDLDSEESLELIRRLSNDPEHSVRGSLFTWLTSGLLRKYSGHVPEHYRHILRSLIVNGDSGLRSTALGTLDSLDLEAPETSDVVLGLLVDSDVQVRSRAIRALLEALQANQLAALPDCYIHALCQALSGDSLLDYQLLYDHNLLFKFLALPNMPGDAQWNFIKGLLMSDEKSFSADMRDALFLPVPREQYRNSHVTDWQQFRERFRPLSMSSQEELAQWANGAIQSDNENKVLAGAGLLAAIAPDDADRLTALLTHESKRVRLTVLESLRPTCDQIPWLLELLNDGDAGIHRAAVLAMGQFDGQFAQKQIDQIITSFHAEQSSWNVEAWIHLFKKFSPGTIDGEQLIADSLIGAPGARAWALQEIERRNETAKWSLRLLDGIRAGRLGPEAAILVIEAGQPIDSPEDATRMLQCGS